MFSTNHSQNVNTKPATYMTTSNFLPNLWYKATNIFLSITSLPFPDKMMSSIIFLFWMLSSEALNKGRVLPLHVLKHALS
jgi:hypothetical protein